MQNIGLLFDRSQPTLLPISAKMFSRLISISMLGLGLAAFNLPAMARPEIASGDQWLEGVSQLACLDLVDEFIEELNVPSDTGNFDRTGYFDDGVFRVLCYSGGSASSLLVVFSSHSESIEDATQFMQFAVQEITLLAPSQGN